MNRGWSDGVLGVVFVLMVVVYAFGFFAEEEIKIPFPTLSKETTVLSGPLDEAGFVDYITDLNQRAAEGVTTDDNFEIVVREVMGDGNLSEIRDEYYRWLGTSPQGNIEKKFQTLGDFLLERLPGESADAVGRRRKIQELQYELCDQPWSGKDHPLSAEWLKRNETYLKLIVEGSRRTRNFCPLTVSKEDKRTGISLIDCSLPSSEEKRELVRALRLRSAERLHAGDSEGSWEDLQAIHRISRLTTQTEHPIEWLAGMAFEMSACEGEIVFLKHSTLSAEGLRAKGQDLKNLREIPSPSGLLDRCGRYMFLECATKAYCQAELLEKLADSVPAIPHGVARILSTKQLDQMLIWGNQQFDRMSAIGRIANSIERNEESERLRAEFEDSLESRKKKPAFDFLTLNPGEIHQRNVRDIVFAATAPAMQIFDSAQRGIVRREMVRVAFLLETYRRERGEFPDDLKRFATEMQEKIPSDQFCGKSFHYERRGEGCLLVSFGLNQRDESTGSVREGADATRIGDDLVIELGGVGK